VTGSESYDGRLMRERARSATTVADDKTAVQPGGFWGGAAGRVQVTVDGVAEAFAIFGGMSQWW